MVLQIVTNRKVEMRIDTDGLQISGFANNALTDG